MFKNAPEVKEKLEAELKQEEGEENYGGAELDEEHLVADYQSDGEAGASKDSERSKDSDGEEEEEHCTKVREDV